jgi:hypothetical protein
MVQRPGDSYSGCRSEIQRAKALRYAWLYLRLTKYAPGNVNQLMAADIKLNIIRLVLRNGRGRGTSPTRILPLDILRALKAPRRIVVSGMIFECLSKKTSCTRSMTNEF